MSVMTLLAISTDFEDYAVHFLVDALGAATALYARRFCRHRHHQFLIWFGLALLVSFTTVNLVG